MSLADRLMEDMKSAMKRGEKEKLNTIRQLRAQIKDAQIAQGHELSDEEIVSVLMNAAKKRREAQELYEKGGRPELAAKEAGELAVIQAYLPKQLTADEIRELVQSVIQQVGARGAQDLGKVMGPVMGKVRGRADGRQVQEIVRQLLQ